MIAVRSLNLALRFLLELALLFILAYWGFNSNTTALLRIVLAISLPALAAVVWGTFVAPAAKRRLSMPLRLIAELIIFSVAVAALSSRGQGAWAWTFGLTYALNRILMFAWRQ